MKLSRQSKLVLDHLKSNPHLTAWQAEGVYRIRRLASRVDELRAAGYEVEKETCEDATGQRYTRYSLSKRQRRAKHPLLPPRTAPKQFRLERIQEAYLLYCAKTLGMEPSEASDDMRDFTKFLTEFGS